MIPAGTEVEVTVTFLEMAERPAYDRPSVPVGPPTALLRAEAPPVWWFLDLYRAVGHPHEWTDRFEDSTEDLAAFVGDDDVHLYTLMRTGWPAGFFVLDFRARGACELAYFGLVPEAQGKGLGGYLLRTAVHTAWDGPGVGVVRVETNTLDHPAALSLYQTAGFAPVAQEVRRRILTRDRDA